MKRFLVACLLLLSAVPALAQKTAAPFTLQQYFDDNGDPLSAGGMCVFAAGTSTLANSYTTAAGSVANANPLLFDPSGRPDSNGFFLTPGVSYKLVLVDFDGVGSPSCSPINGVTIWTQDNILAVPSSSALIEVSTATAGENISAGDAVYLSDGGGSRTAGRWYRTDADFTYASSEAPFVGVATAAITSGQNGTVVILGLVTLAGPFSPGTAYYASASAGATTATAPTNTRVVGTAQSTTAFLVSPFNAYRIPNLSSSNILNAIQLNTLACGRLTLTTGVPVTTSDVTAATTVYYTPAGKCNQIGLYTSSSFWVARTFSEVSIAVPATTNTNYDVYAYDNAGTVTLELLAWNAQTAGASLRHAAGTYSTVLPQQDGVWVKSTNGTAIDNTRRYLGSFRTTGVSGQTEDSFAKRFLWNVANQVTRPMRVLEATNTWPYNNALNFRQANNSAANQLAFIVGVAGMRLSARIYAQGIDSTGVVQAAVAVGMNSATTPTTEGVRGGFANATEVTPIQSMLDVYPAIGYSFAAWLEQCASANTFTWYGDNGAPTIYQSGIYGEIDG